MSLLFGNLTQDFVSFGLAENAYMQDVNNATALQQLELSAAQFRHSASSDALYLVCLGTSPPPFYIYLLMLFQESVCSSAHTPTWSSGYTPAR